MNEKELFLGTIAPDISKQIGEKKTKSHFLTNKDNDYPNLDDFLDKYQNNLTNPFIMGYYIHLFTDKLWFDKFLNSLVQSNSIKLMDGTILNTTPEGLRDIIYTDYTNLNIKIIEEYNMDLSLFYEEFQKPNTKIEEIPINKLNILIDKMGVIIENSKREKNYVFDIYLVKQFIEDTKERILQEIKDYECVTS